ncbi:MAG: agmatine deiminase [Cellulomonas sp. 73-145]|uniref:agmatine deiminase n=1 Tax=Cellulomonas sp. 73-145 TaxID=1895739 RepID=UPI00092C850A|nr:agmatine deiminase [Cellulomonas sp. 73-145]MBN9326311.1 agmatine deiminase [Cellulomonas sp.]OJV59009.1 MAG: agmatine deiminase [Cellulomonas sp. 73-145]
MARTLDSTPAADGYRMPAEWAHHAGCWLVWPERPDNWRLGGKPAQAAFTAVATAIAQTEAVTVAVSARQYDNARSQLPEHVRVVEMSNDDSWMRDTGPTFVVNDDGDVRGVDWVFNAWGGLVDGLYFPWAADDAVARKVLELEGVDRYRAPLVLEGGSIDVDGEGTVLVTEECLLSAGRNPDLTRADIEQQLRDHLGVEVVVWLPYGVYLDETNGHVDNFCRFVRPGVVMLTWTDDETDPQFERSAAALKVLESTTDARGRSFEVVKIHQPGPIFITEEESRGVDSIEGTLPREAGDRLAGSYVNSYIGNDLVVLPVFEDPHDDAAVAAYTQLFAPRHIVTVPGREILLGGGNVHCITQQQPSGR